MLKKSLLVCLLAVPAGVFAQGRMPNLPPSTTSPINRAELMDKTWYFVGMKCPDKIGLESENIHWFASLKLTFSNINNINYGTYEKTYRDMRDNPHERGSYTLTTDEVGNVILTLKKKRTGEEAKYIVPMVETNHLTMIRIDEGEKCNFTYAIAP